MPPELSELETRRRARLEQGSTLKGAPADLDWLKCVDLGHRWHEVELVTQQRGPLSGLPLRVCVCDLCDTTRLEVLNWGNGGIVTRQYVHDAAWLEALRALDPDDHWARRPEYRRRMLAALPDHPDRKAGSNGRKRPRRSA